MPKGEERKISWWIQDLQLRMLWFLFDFDNLFRESWKTILKHFLVVKFFATLWTIIMSIGIIFIKTDNQLSALRAISIIFRSYCINGKFSIAVISFYRFLITTIKRIVTFLSKKISTIKMTHYFLHRVILISSKRGTQNLRK